MKKFKVSYISIPLTIILLLGAFFSIPRVLMEPHKTLQKEFLHEESLQSFLRVKFFLWCGADPAKLVSQNDVANPYNFALISALMYERTDVIHLLKANYTDEQKAMAYEVADGRKDLEVALDTLFAD